MVCLICLVYLGCLVKSVCLVYSVYLVCLVETDAISFAESIRFMVSFVKSLIRTDPTDRMDKIDLLFFLLTRT